MPRTAAKVTQADIARTVRAVAQARVRKTHPMSERAHTSCRWAVVSESGRGVTAPVSLSTDGGAGR